MTINSGIVAPPKPGIKFHNSVMVYLNGGGGMNHVINNQGSNVRKGKMLSYVCEWNGGHTLMNNMLMNLDASHKLFKKVTIKHP